MVKHVVMWKVKDKNADPPLIKAKLLSMKGKIKALGEFEVGINYNPGEAAFDVVLISTHTNRDSLDEYQKDPVHREVSAFVRERITARQVVDFES